jgi:uncharacterized membrane protein
LGSFWQWLRHLHRNAHGTRSLLRPDEPSPVTTNRLESFSDGVLAVAITLLILDVTVPESEHLGHALLHRWPHYAAYVTSFVTIGIIWINHHVMIGRLREADHAILMLNLLLLVTVVVIPFATSLLAAYLNRSSGAHVAAAVYGGVFLAMAVAFTLVQRQILFSKYDLLKQKLSLETRRRIFRRTVAGLLPYVVATALAAVSQYLTLAITAAVAVYYALPLAASVGVTE